MASTTARGEAPSVPVLQYVTLAGNRNCLRAAANTSASESCAVGANASSSGSRVRSPSDASVSRIGDAAPKARPPSAARERNVRRLSGLTGMGDLRRRGRHLTPYEQKRTGGSCTPTGPPWTPWPQDSWTVDPGLWTLVHSGRDVVVRRDLAGVEVNGWRYSR